MSDDFTGSSAAGNFAAPATDWTVTSVSATPVFVPYPSSGNPATEEVGYGEGGYGEGGYDTPAVPAVNAPTIDWTSYTTK